MKKSKPLVFGVFGGSYTAGHECDVCVNEQQQACAWPSRLQNIVEVGLGVNLTLYNLGMGGTTSKLQKGLHSS